MRWFRSAVLLGLGVVVMAAAVAQEDPGEFKEVYMWNKLAFDFPDDVTRVRVLSDARLDNCLLHALRLWKGRLFATLPRWRAGVPVTLASLPAAVTQHNVSGPNLTPFPSWDMQAQGNCSALQSVVGVEVDLKGRLWAADSGAVNTLDGGGTRDQPCKPKVVQFDAETGRILRTFQLGDDVVAPDSLLADVVVGDDDMAYVSDASPTSPGIIVLDGHDGRSWKMSEPSSMRGENMFVQVEQRRTELRFNVFALALSPRDPASPTGRRLYYAPLNSKHVFSLPVSALADPGYRSSLANLAKDHGERASPTQAMTLDSAGRLYSGPLTESGVDRWDTTRELSSTKLISQDHVRLQWPSSLTVDEQGFLWVVSNRMHVYMAGTLNQYDSNYRVIRASVGAAKSYMHDLASSSSSQGQGQGLPPQTTPPSTTTTQHATHSTPHKSKTNAASPSFLASTPLMLAVVARVAFA